MVTINHTFDRMSLFPFPGRRLGSRRVPRARGGVGHRQGVHGRRLAERIDRALGAHRVAR